MDQLAEELIACHPTLDADNETEYVPIFLEPELTNRLVREIYGGFEGLAAAWEDMAEEREGFPAPKQRASLYRWLTKGIPVKSPDLTISSNQEADFQLFGLCALLDADPLALFDYERNGYFSRFSTLRQMIYFGQKKMGSLARLLELYRPGDSWPSDEIASRCYGRSWFAHELTNKECWNNNDYILLKIKFQSHPRGRPRAVHIAYRRTGVPDTMWRYYGTVLAIDGELRLYSESGSHDSNDQMEEDEIRFRTYFGGRPVVWRIASLHGFQLQSIFPYNDMRTIGFNW